MVFNETQPFDDKEHEAFIGLWYTGVMLKRRSRQFFRNHPVNDSGFNALMALKYAEKPLSQQDLSLRLLVDKSNITAVVDALEKLGYVKRAKMPGDRRFYRLKITPAALAFLDTVEKDYRAEVHRIMSCFSPAEVAAITAFMVRVQKGMETEK